MGTTGDDKLDRVTRMFALKISKVHRTVSMNAGTILSSILPLDLRAKEYAELYGYKKGKPIQNLPGRHLECEISPFSLPHPTMRVRIPFGSLSTKADLDEITVNVPQLFTDGSKIEGKVGAAVSYWEDGKEVANSTIKLADYCSVFQAELVAIEKAVEMIGRRGKNIKQFQVLSDSKSALQNIEDGHSCNPITVEIRRKLKELMDRDKIVTFYWIKAHEGLAGNERADELAKRAAIYKKTAPAYDAVPVSFAKWHIRDVTLNAWQARYEEESTGSTTKYFFPDVRKAHRTLKKLSKLNNRVCQLFTGHGGFGEYLHRFKLKLSPVCECDGSTPETVLHVICVCPIHAAARTDLEIRTGVSVAQQNLAGLLESDHWRDVFMEYALNIIRKVNIRNNSKMVL